jgi:hypothetical protein
MYSAADYVEMLMYNPRNSTFIPERAVTSPLAIVNLV